MLVDVPMVELTFFRTRPLKVTADRRHGAESGSTEQHCENTHLHASTRLPLPFETRWKLVKNNRFSVTQVLGQYGGNTHVGDSC